MTVVTAFAVSGSHSPGLVVEVVPQMRHQLGVGRVIRRFDADDLDGTVVPLQVHVSEEVELRVTGTDEKDLDRTASLEGPDDLSKVPVLIVGVIPDAQVDLIGVTMDVTAGRIDDRMRDLVGVDLEDPSFLLIDPDDCVLHGEVSLSEVWGASDGSSIARSRYRFR